MTRRPGNRSGAVKIALALLIAAPVFAVIATLLASLARFEPTVWTHLLTYWLPEVLGNTALIMLGVGLGVTVLGTALAALVALTEFPGRRVFAVALLLPMAMPGYVLATVVIGQLDFAGPLATLLRAAGLSVPPIRSVAGLVLTLTLTLYPYVYLVARGAFASQGARTLEAARLMGFAPWQAFWRVLLPQARPWILGGALLALMETLADFGTASAFGVTTFTTAIYRAWFALFSIDVALQLALVMLVLVALLVMAERLSRRRARFVSAQGAQAPLSLGRWRWAATGLCGGVLLLGFGLPVLQLGHWALSAAAPIPQLLPLAGRSLALAAMAAGLTVTAAVLLAIVARTTPGRRLTTLQTVATLGYALPGPLLALGLFVPYAGGIQWLNQQFDLAWMVHGGVSLLLLAYAVRFMAVAHTPLHTQLMRLSPSVDDAARLLGVGRLARLQTVYLPPLNLAMLTAALLVFVDVMKEMPITLMMRPFGWETLAVRVFEFTREGQWAAAGAPSLAIVAVGLLPVLLLTRVFNRKAADVT